MQKFRKIRSEMTILEEREILICRTESAASLQWQALTRLPFRRGILQVGMGKGYLSAPNLRGEGAGQSPLPGRVGSIGIVIIPILWQTYRHRYFKSISIGFDIGTLKLSVSVYIQQKYLYFYKHFCISEERSFFLQLLWIIYLVIALFQQFKLQMLFIRVSFLLL